MSNIQDAINDINYNYNFPSLNKLIKIEKIEKEILEKEKLEKEKLEKDRLEKEKLEKKEKKERLNKDKTCIYGKVIFQKRKYKCNCCGKEIAFNSIYKHLNSCNQN